MEALSKRRSALLRDQVVEQRCATSGISTHLVNCIASATVSDVKDVERPVDSHERFDRGPLEDKGPTAGAVTESLRRRFHKAQSKPSEANNEQSKPSDGANELQSCKLHLKTLEAEVSGLRHEIQLLRTTFQEARVLS